MALQLQVRSDVAEVVQLPVHTKTQARMLEEYKFGKDGDKEVVDFMTEHQDIVTQLHNYNIIFYAVVSLQYYIIIVSY